MLNRLARIRVSRKMQIATASKENREYYRDGNTRCYVPQLLVEIVEFVYY